MTASGSGQQHAAPDAGQPSRGGGAADRDRGGGAIRGVLGALQWLVVRERVPISRKVWITSNIGPALLAWLLVIMPAVIEAQNSYQDASTAYLLAASQALGLPRQQPA